MSTRCTTSGQSGSSCCRWTDLLGQLRAGYGHAVQPVSYTHLDVYKRQRGGRNQYPPGPGVPELLQAIAAHQDRFYGLTVDPHREVLVTAGATEAIAATILALCEPGDEVVTFEPYYDSYAATIALAGAVRRTSVLRFPDFAVDVDSLSAAFSERTRLVLLNSPHNPTGKVFTRAELELVADLARRHDAWVVTDEVYEHITFDGVAHIPMATLPGMAERCLLYTSRCV